MSKIDKRIVEMGFENKGFEKGVKESSTSLKDFNNALEKTGGSGSRLSGLGGIVGGLTGGFGVLGTMATGALMKIGSMAVQTGIRLAKSLSLDQITAGFAEYELKINSIKTILAGGRTAEGLPVTLDMVNKKLAELNTYADQTIYSFSDMTRNIGKFTNAGVDLDAAVASIKGISNVAAVSGANAEEAARAMYNFAQALSAGYVKFIDWKSIENANMATIEFKEQLLESAVAAGTLEKTADGMYKVLTGGGNGGELISASKGFNQSLQDQWMTTEVLTGTLQDYSDVTTEIGAKATEAATKVRTFSQLMDTVKEAIGSGWGVTFENIFGNYEEATDLWSNVSQSIDKLVSNSAKARNRIIGDWSRLGGRDALIEGLSSVWQTFSRVLLIVRDAWRDTFGIMKRFKLTAMTKDFRDFLIGLKPGRKEIVALKKIFRGFFSALKLGWNIVSSVFKGLAGGFKLIIDAVGGKGKGLLYYLGGIGEFFTKISDWAEKGQIFTKISEGIAKGIGWIVTQITNLITGFKDGTIFDSIRNFFKDINIDLPDFKLPDFKGFSKIGEVFSKIGEGISSAFSKVKEAKDDIKIFDRIKEILGNFVLFIKEKFGPQIELLKEFGQKIKDFFGDNFDFGSLVDSLTKLATVFIGGGLAKNFGDFLGSFGGVGDEAQGFLKGLTKDITSLGGVKGILGDFQGILKSYQSNLDSKKLLTIASAIAILVASLAIITLLDQTKLLSGVGVITALFANLSGGLVVLSKAGNPKKMAASMVLMAGAVLILSLSLLMLKDVDTGAMFALTILVAELVAANLLMSKMGDTKKGTISLLGMAAAIQVLAGAVFIFGKFKPDELKQGMIAVSILMAEMVVFSLLLGNFGGSSGKMLAAGVAMGIMAIALLEMTGVVAILAQFEPEKLKTGLLGLAGIMVIMAAGMIAVANPKVLIGAAAMLVMAAAIAILTPSIMALAQLPIEKIGLALLAIAGMFAVFGIAAVILTPVVPIIFSLAVALALLGVAILAAGVGMALFGVGLAAVAASGGAAAAILTVAIMSIAALIPYLMTKVGEGIIALAGVIIEGAPVIAEAVGAIITSMLSMATQQIPAVVDLLLTLVGDLLKILVEKVPEFVDSGMKIILGFLKGIADNVGSIVEEIFNLLINILDAIAEKLPELIAAGVNVVTSFLEGIGEEVPKVVDAAFQMIIDFINGLADSIEENTPLILAAVANLATAFIEGVEEYLNLEEGESIAGNIIQGLIDGVNLGVDLVLEAVTGLGKAVIAGVKAILGIKSPSKPMTDFGEQLDYGLIKGIVRVGNKVVQAAKDVGENAMDGLRSAMSNLSDVVNSELDTNPTITPVLNLDQIRDEAKNLTGILPNGQTYGLAALQIRQDKEAARANQNGSNFITDTGTGNITNEFNLNGVTIRSEADIDKLAKALYERQENAMRIRGIKPSYAY